MAKQKKNSNYSTEKKQAKEAKAAEIKRKEQTAKTVKLVAIWAGGALLLIALVVGLLFALGVFDYVPEATYHASFTFSDGNTIHVELYGNDAPETVEHFIDLCESDYFTGMTLRSMLDGMLKLGSGTADGGDLGIKGEFSSNGFNNQIPMKRGYVGLSRGASADSGYGQFFILTSDRRDLQGKYAIFGGITDMSVVDAMLSKLTVNKDGTIYEGNAPRILSVSLHAAHH